MGKVYQSVRGVVQGTLHRRKPDIMVSARPKGNDSSLNDAMEELEKIFVDGIGRLKAAVSDDQAVVASEAQQVEQVIEGLRANITVLEAKLRETEETVHRKDLASQKMEETLSAEIRDLQSCGEEERRSSGKSRFRSKRSQVQNRCPGRAGNPTWSWRSSRQKEKRRVRPNKPSKLSRVSRQPSLGWRLSLRRRRTPSIEKTLPAKTWKKLLKPRSAIYKVW